MNGRAYDPFLGMFLSLDNFVQSPDLTQNFNRYAYCLNNPLKYTDPDGQWFITALVMLGNMYLNGAAANNWEFNPTKWDRESPQTWVALVRGGFAGWQKGSDIETRANSIINRKKIDRVSKMIVHDYNSRFEIPSQKSYTYAEGYTASLEYGGGLQPISLGAGEPFLTRRVLLSPNDWTGRYELILQVYGDMYDEYNWLQTATWEHDLYPIDKGWGYNHGFYYDKWDNINQGGRYKAPDADYFFEDNPNAQYFNAELTLFGRKGENWHQIRTISWGYSITNGGNVLDYFKLIDASGIHLDNIIKTLRYHNGY